MANLVLGIDLGGTHFQIGLVDPDHRILGRARGLTPGAAGLDAVLAALVTGVHEACADADVALSEVAGLGIGAPAPIDPTGRIVINAVNLRWRDVPFADRMEDLLPGVQVVLDNDVNVAVWGEHQAGAARGYRNVLGVWVGTGIGGGLVLEDRLFRGSTGTAGEIGHVVVTPEAGPAAEILEQHGARSSLLENARRLIRANHATILTDLVGGQLDTLSISHLRDALEQGDAMVSELIDHSARLVGLSCANVVTLLGLDCIVLGGGVTETIGEPYLRRVRTAFDRYVYPDQCRACALVPTALRDNAGIIGAAALARARFA